MNLPQSEIERIKREAITVFELTKGFTPEQRESAGNTFHTMEQMTGYVLDLVAYAERAQQEKQEAAEDERSKLIELVLTILETEPINRARYMNEVSDLKIKSNF